MDAKHFEDALAGQPRLAGVSGKKLRSLLQERAELLEALEEALPVLESLDISREEGDEEVPLLARVRAAIAKARGK